MESVLYRRRSVGGKSALLNLSPIAASVYHHIVDCTSQHT
jgi:hypothetical protein